MQEPSLSPKLRLALEACKVARPLLTGEICISCIDDEYKAMVVTYRDLAALARCGYLTRIGQMRNAVYYRLIAPKRRRK